MDAKEAALFIFAGAIGGFINTVASSGSAITLPVLMMLGIPAPIANGTNRIPLLIGSSTASWTFHRKGVIDWKNAAYIAPAMLLGSLFGAYVSTLMNAKNMSLAVIAAVMMAFVLLVVRPSRMLDPQPGVKPAVIWPHMIAYFLIGFWAGFIVLDSATFMLLSFVMLAHFELIPANAMKNVMLVVISIPSVLIFGLKGEIDWGIGAALAVGSVAGSTVGGRFSTSPAAKVWIFRLLLIIVAVEIVHMLWLFGHLNEHIPKHMHFTHKD
jgi:uncharacterized membrane protein YfcA